MPVRKAAIRRGLLFGQIREVSSNCSEIHPLHPLVMATNGGGDGDSKSGASEGLINSDENGSGSSQKPSGVGCSTDDLKEALVLGSIVGAAAGLVMHFRGSSGAFGWKAFPYSIVRGALAFGPALGIYEAAKCKIMQTGVLDDISSSIAAGGLGTGTGGVIYGGFPWTMPNSTKVYAEKFQQQCSVVRSFEGRCLRTSSNMLQLVDFTLVLNL